MNLGKYCLESPSPLTLTAEVIFTVRFHFQLVSICLNIQITLFHVIFHLLHESFHFVVNASAYFSINIQVMNLVPSSTDFQNVSRFLTKIAWIWFTNTTCCIMKTSATKTFHRSTLSCDLHGFESSPLISTLSAYFDSENFFDLWVDWTLTGIQWNLSHLIDLGPAFKIPDLLQFDVWSILLIGYFPITYFWFYHWSNHG